MFRKCHCGMLVGSEVACCPYCGWDSMSKEWSGRNSRVAKKQWYRADHVSILVRHTYGFRNIDKTLHISPIK